MPNTNSIKLSVSVRKTNTARCCKTDKAGAIEKSNDFKLTDHRQEKRADTRLLAQALGLKHRSLFEQVESYKADFEAFGVVRFQTDQPLPSSKGGRPERFALLNENQAHLLLTFSRNTTKVRALKIKLVQAFANARRAAEMHQSDYLPAYHLLHDAIKAAANGSPNERHHHINANKALNKLTGLQPGQRASAGPGVLSVLTVAQAFAAKAVQDHGGAHGLHDRIKAALLPLEGVLALVANEGALVLEGGA